MKIASMNKCRRQIETDRKRQGEREDTEKIKNEQRMCERRFSFGLSASLIQSDKLSLFFIMFIDDV